MIGPVALVALGGAAAAVFQYALYSAPERATRVTFTTLVVSGALGFVSAAAPPAWILALVGIGFLASAAPFGAIAAVTVDKVRARRYRSALAFATLNVIGGIACVMAGYLSLKSGVTLYHKLF